jgi:phage-related protein
LAACKIFLYRDERGRVPLLEWLDELPDNARTKCLHSIERLMHMGHELRRPAADYLRDGIYELRIQHMGLNYRVLYFFAGQSVVIASHGLIKERAVPPRDIDLAIARMKQVAKDFDLFAISPRFS